MNAVEAVEGFSVNFSGPLDVKGHLKALTLLNNRHVPNDMETAFSFFGGHGHVVTLSTSALELVILDLKLRWKNVVDVEVAKGRIAVVLKQNQHFIATFAAQRDGLLTGAEVATVVNDLDRR